MPVKSHAVALNAADWTDLDHEDSGGYVVGLDYASVVVHVDKHVSKPFKVGDRVMGVVHGLHGYM
jgi:NADPH:quinone reductase-like Zn-dependent oxidoreductase